MAAAALVVLGVGLTGCDRAGDSGPTAATVPAGSTGTVAVTAPVPLLPVPSPIDVAYAQRVIDELDRALGAAAAVLVRDGAPTKAFDDALRLGTVSLAAEHWATEFGRSAAAGFGDMAAAPAPAVTVIDRIHDWNPTCFVAGGRRDLSPIWPGRPGAYSYVKFLAEPGATIPWRIAEDAPADRVDLTVNACAG